MLSTKWAIVENKRTYVLIVSHLVAYLLFWITLVFTTVNRTREYENVVSGKKEKKNKAKEKENL